MLLADDMIIAPMHTSTDRDTQPIPSLRPPLRHRSAVHYPHLWPMVAFWVGMALFFAISSVLSAIHFAEILVGVNLDWQMLAAHQMAWLGAAVFLFACSVISSALALLVFARHISGLYGSLLFGLLLTLIAPLIGLLVPQPNYLGAVCAGLVPAASVLYAILNMERFSSD